MHRNIYSARIGKILILAICIVIVIWIAVAYRNELKCKINLKMIYNALQTYQNDYGELPKPDEWGCQLLKANLISEDYLQCPSRKRKGSKGHYVLNSYVERNNKEIPNDLVLIFEGKVGCNQVSGIDAAVFPHRNKCGIILVNGKIEMLEAERKFKINWGK